MFKNFKVIEVISSKTKAQMTFYMDKIKFNKFTAPDLDDPLHVQLLIDANNKHFAIRVCDKNADNAVAFVKNKDKVKLYPITVRCKAATEMISNIMGWKDSSKYYVIPGQKFAEEKAIVFNLNDADEFDITTRGGSSTPEDEE